MSKDSKAIQTRGKLLKFNPTGEYYFSKGLKAYHKRDFHKAKKYLERAMHLEPGEPMIVCQLAIISTEMGDYQYSNKLLHMILDELDEHMTECHYFLANNYAHLGFFKDAYHHANLYLELEEDGDFADDTEDLLDLLTLEAGELDEDLYEQDDLITKQEQARELLESGNFPKAVELLNLVIKEYPEYWSAYNNLALANFYLGDVQKAADILEDVLVKNPGNLHALCNQLVFAFYQKDFKEVKRLKDMLKKIKPILLEHQFKLGATFALVGEYESAFTWLRKLQKQGFEGDGPFYYWLAYSAFYTGKESFAKNVWKKVIEMNPDKKGLEPWNEEKASINGFEDHISTIAKKMQSDYLEERLFGIFLTSVSKRKDEILAADIKKDKFSALENNYLTIVKTGKHNNNHASLLDAHETAKLLYHHHQPVGTVEAGLYLMWFSIFADLAQAKLPVKNQKAWAAATEYVWRKLRNEKVSQPNVAEQYGLSPSTLQKYVKLVKNHLE